MAKAKSAKLASIINKTRGAKAVKGTNKKPTRNQELGLPQCTRSNPDDPGYQEDVIKRDDNGRWQKGGGGGNPGGKPNHGKSMISLTARLKTLLQTPSQADGMEEGAQKADELIQIAYQAARRGDFRFFQEIFNRIDGKVADKTVLQEETIKLYDVDTPVDEV